MIFDLRIYTLQPAKLQLWLKFYEQNAFPIQCRHLGPPVMFSTTEVGVLNQVVHMWKYDSQADREQRRGKMQLDPEWIAYLKKNAELGALVSFENRILKPTSFSPLA